MCARLNCGTQSILVLASGSSGPFNQILVVGPRSIFGIAQKQCQFATEDANLKDLLGLPLRISSGAFAMVVNLLFFPSGSFSGFAGEHLLAFNGFEFLYFRAVSQSSS